MNQFSQWLSMGGYSYYVWSAYGLASIILLLNLVSIKSQRQRIFKNLEQWFKRQTK